MKRSADPDDRFEQLRPTINKCLFVAGAILLVDIVCIAVSYGNMPLVDAGYSGRLVISIVGMIALAVFVVLGGLVAGEFLIERYSDTRKPTR